VEVRARARYVDGFRYCSNCKMWYRTDGPRCPKCGRVLRAGSRRKRGDRAAIDPEKYLGT